MNKIDSFRKQYYFLSNFYERNVEYNGLTYKNNEAAFQAQKCKTEEEKLQFINLNASEAKKLGRKVSLRADWEDIKVNVMRDVVKAKFEQNGDLKDALLATNDAYLEEGNTWGDRTWGTVNGSGANLLGQILMNVREKLKEKENIEEIDYYER
ncbi:NADAR family protein [Agathobacter rectalis]|uniref:DUF1768 domain-containing protein n=1 Tax=Agathobacter rectalis TaxID=39491 RepID=A0A3E4YC62_9FIRM|nr:NADAR family protein [Agathobacter rectalis]RGM72153.1 DUF1768 domain-containing protein [Agathobacter rectalis]